MKRSEIEIGAELAFQESKYTHVARVRVLGYEEVPASGSGRYFVGPQSGYRVEFLDEPSEKLGQHARRMHAKGKQRSATGRQLIGTWEAVTAERAKAEQAEQVARDAAQAEQQRLIDDASKANFLLSNLGLPEAFTIAPRQTATSTTILELLLGVHEAVRRETKDVAAASLRTKRDQVVDTSDWSISRDFWEDGLNTAIKYLEGN